MTVLPASMSIPVRELLSRPKAACSDMQSGGISAADANARRLTAAIARGDEFAFGELYDRYRERLFRLAFVLGRGDPSLAQDIVQSVFITAAAKLRRLATEEHLWNWLARVARQHLAKAWRQRQRDRHIVGVAQLPESIDHSESLLEEHLEAALLELDTDDRQLLEWFYFEGLHQKELAAQLNTTPKAISCRLERARARLRQLLSRKLAHER